MTTAAASRKQRRLSGTLPSELVQPASGKGKQAPPKKACGNVASSKEAFQMQPFAIAEAKELLPGHFRSLNCLTALKENALTTIIVRACFLLAPRDGLEPPT